MRELRAPTSRYRSGVSELWSCVRNAVRRPRPHNVRTDNHSRKERSPHRPPGLGSGCAWCHFRTQLSQSGLFSISVAGSHGLGEAGEPRVKKILRQRLQMDGADVVFEPGVNSDGEDGILVFGGQRYALQITMALSRDRVDWAAASTGKATALGNVEDVADWIDEAIKSKVAKTDPGRTILALDANHLGIMADVALTSCYQERFGSPSKSFGFAAVWLVGPTVERCLRLE
jgi:hypothetical protein